MDEPRPDLELPEALILGAGRGERLGRGPKAFIQVRGAALIQWAVWVVRPFVGKINVCVPAENQADARRLLPVDVNVIAGGTTRVESLRFLVAASTAASVLVHDVVHPLADRPLVERIIAAARQTGAASAAMPLYGSVHDVRGERIGATMGTSLPGPLWLTQKPAVVPRAALLHGLELDSLAPRAEGAATVDSVARAGVRTVVVPTAQSNVKITELSDLKLAEQLCQPWPGWDGWIES